MVIYVLFFIVSFFLYQFAPENYSPSFCNIVFVLFCVNSLLFVNRYFRQKKYFNFHFFFLISFFFTNFAYPIFIYPIDPEYFTIFKYEFDEKLISSAAALSQLGVSSYVLGAVFLSKYRKKQQRLILKQYVFSPKIVYLFLALTFLSSILFLFHALYLNIYQPEEVVLSTQVVNICVVFFTISVTIIIYNTRNTKSLGIFGFLWSNKILTFVAVLIILVSLWFGDRGPAIQIFFIFMYIIVTYIRQIKVRWLLLLVIAGFFVMTLISYTRGSDNNLRSASVTQTVTEGLDLMGSFNSFWNFGMDLIVNNRNLYVGMALRQERGLLYGTSYFPYLFAFIPGMPALMTYLLFDKTTEEVSTGFMITEYTGTSWGLGSNAIGDLYMNFGVVGVVFGFGLFGYLIYYLEDKENIYLKISYILILALAIYYPRSSIYVQLSLIVRAVIVLFLVMGIIRNSYYTYNRIDRQASYE